MKITSLILEYLNYGNNDLYGLLNANITNLIPIKRLLKGKENSIFHRLNLTHKIIDRLSKGGRNAELSYGMLFRDSITTKADSKEKKASLDDLTADIYLHNVIKEKYKHLGEFQKQLESIH